jgi:multisubunit Na+/H+ antiporter MnhF subunit
MEVRGKLFDWLLELMFRNAGVNTTVIVVCLVTLIYPRERRSALDAILAIGLVMFFGGHLMLRITVPGQTA